MHFVWHKLHFSSYQAYVVKSVITPWCRKKKLSTEWVSNLPKVIPNRLKSWGAQYDHRPCFWPLHASSKESLFNVTMIGKILKKCSPDGTTAPSGKGQRWDKNWEKEQVFTKIHIRPEKGPCCGLIKELLSSIRSPAKFGPCALVMALWA